MSQWSYHMTKSHEEYGKIVYKLYSSCISSVQEIHEDFIKFSLSTQTWSGFKLSWLKFYNNMRDKDKRPSRWNKYAQWPINKG